MDVDGYGWIWMVMVDHPRMKNIGKPQEKVMGLHGNDYPLVMSNIGKMAIYEIVSCFSQMLMLNSYVNVDQRMGVLLRAECPWEIHPHDIQIYLYILICCVHIYIYIHVHANMIYTIYVCIYIYI